MNKSLKPMLLMEESNFSSIGSIGSVSSVLFFDRLFFDSQEKRKFVFIQRSISKFIKIIYLLPIQHMQPMQLQPPNKIEILNIKFS